MRRLPTALLTGAFVAAALGLSLLVPTDQVQQAPYVRTIPGFDARTETREFVATVSRARLADRVQTPEWTGTTDGVWLVVDITFESRIDKASLAGSLRVGQTDFRTTSRTDETIDQPFAAPGIPWSGSMLFELPASVLDDPDASSAVLQLATQTDPRLDGVLELTFDLASLQRERSIPLTEPGRVPA